MDVLTAARTITARQLQDLTPVRIDEMVQAVDDEQVRLQAAVSRAYDLVHKAVGDSRRSVRRGAQWSMTREETYTAAAFATDDKTALALGRLAQLRHRLELIDHVRGTLAEEFTRRGGWERAFLVEGPTGHVHRSRRCSTCHHGESPTRFVWMTEYSGRTETQIVQAAGERACTTCYRSAPADALKKPTRMFGPNEIKARAERDERRRRLQARSAVAAEKAIMDPLTGAPLREEAGNRGSVLKTVTSAKRQLASEAWWVMSCLYNNRDAGRHRANVLHLAAAVAGKENTEAAALVAEALAKQSKELSRLVAKNETEARPAKAITADLLARYEACAA
ncbi:hypothetical protein ACIQVO_38140 [Streptomyces sp. NPDC101062]|uniref:hypothetical protein n=1 Tax=unclassified Streptomyces TaxID=2593676 RepID=UPI0038107B71